MKTYQLTLLSLIVFFLYYFFSPQISHKKSQAPSENHLTKALQQEDNKKENFKAKIRGLQSENELHCFRLRDLITQKGILKDIEKQPMASRMPSIEEADLQKASLARLKNYLELLEEENKRLSEGIALYRKQP